MHAVFNTKMYFNADKVLKAVERSERKTLSKIGAYTRQAARSSLRRRKKASAPGSPPSVHSSDRVRTLKMIQFAYEKSTRSVITGPILLRSSKVKGHRPLPQVMEEGARVPLERDGETIMGTYPARPTMGPALDKTLKSDAIPKALQHSVLP